MTIDSKIKVTVKVKGKVKSITISLEGIQLCVQNAERLFQDSQSTSTPTKTALLEIGLEEVSKAWGILIYFIIRILNENPSFLKYLNKYSHLDGRKFNKLSKENSNKIERYIKNAQLENLINPFDEELFSNHKPKVEYLSQVIDFIKNIVLPIFQPVTDRKKLTEELFGKFVLNVRLEDQDKNINEILSISTNNLNEIIQMRENGLYVDIEGGSLVSPSSRRFLPSILNNLLFLLIVSCKNEIVILAKALEEYDENKK